MIFTARKRSLRRLCKRAGVWSWGGGGACSGGSGLGGVPARGGSGPCGGACSLGGGHPSPQPRGGSLGGSGPGPQPRAKLRGIWSKPTAKGEIEGDLVQAHSQGGSWGSGAPLPPNGYCYGRYASYWNAFLFTVLLMAHFIFLILQKLMIDEKKCYFFGRNKHMCDFCIDHSSCSRVHAVLVWHKHLNRPFIVDLGSSECFSAAMLSNGFQAIESKA